MIFMPWDFDCEKCSRHKHRAVATLFAIHQEQISFSSEVKFYLNLNTTAVRPADVFSIYDESTAIGPETSVHILQ